MGLAVDEREDVAEALGIVVAGEENAEERDLLGGEELVDEGVPHGAAGSPAGAVIELDAAENAVGFVLGEKEVDVLVGDLVEG
jgi:hypothetical protein